MSGILRGWAFVVPLVLLCWGMGAAAQPSESGQVERELLNSARSDLAEARTVLERKRLSLTPDEQQRAEISLLKVEQALASYEHFAARRATAGKTDMRALLVTAGATVVADDATGVGVADDVLLPFIALGLIAAQLEAMGPTPDQELQMARARLAMSMLFMTRMVMELAQRKNDGKCQCTCAGLNHGPDPFGRKTFRDCDRLCKAKGYTVTICR